MGFIEVQFERRQDLPCTVERTTKSDIGYVKCRAKEKKKGKKGRPKKNTFFSFREKKAPQKKKRWRRAKTKKSQKNALQKKSAESENLQIALTKVESNNMKSWKKTAVSKKRTKNGKIRGSKKSALFFSEGV